MKANFFLAAAATIFSGALLSGCSGTQQASTGQGYDDVYYTATPQPATETQPATSPGEYTSSNAYQKDPDGDTRFEYTDTGDGQSQGGNVTNNYYYDSDDYYDYAYTARLRRFYRPYGWGYYDSYYTNPYWYNYNPASWGLSIYMGYSWWAPAYAYYSPFTWGFGFNYGWPGYGWCGNYWHNWHHPYGYGYSPYAYGYPGYWGGYAYNPYGYGYGNPYYYNNYDYNSYNSNYYYGPRRNTTGSSSTAGTPRPSVAQLYTAALPERSNPPVISTVTSEMAPVRAGTPESPATQGADKGIRQDKAPARPDQYTPRTNTGAAEGKKPVRTNVQPDAAPVNDVAKPTQPVRTNDTKTNDQQKPRQYEQPDVQPSRSNPVRPAEQAVPDRPGQNYSEPKGPDRSKPSNSVKPGSNDRPRENYYEKPPQQKPRENKKPRGYEAPKKNRDNSGYQPSRSQPQSTPRVNSSSSRPSKSSSRNSGKSGSSGNKRN